MGRSEGLFYIIMNDVADCEIHPPGSRVTAEFPLAWQVRAPQQFRPDPRHVALTHLPRPPRCLRFMQQQDFMKLKINESPCRGDRHFVTNNGVYSAQGHSLGRIFRKEKRRKTTEQITLGLNFYQTAIWQRWLTSIHLISPPREEKLRQRGERLL